MDTKGVQAPSLTFLFFFILSLKELAKKTVTSDQNLCDSECERPKYTLKTWMPDVQTKFTGVQSEQCEKF